MPKRSKHSPKVQDRAKSGKSQRGMSQPNGRATNGRVMAGHVRIVAGQWRGRKIPVVDVDGLRPTGDRVRETLFNWLQMEIPGRRCLDLFAGSGALGLEAASRGAASVTLIESSAIVASQLKQTMDELQAGGNVLMHNVSATGFLDTHPEPFDLVFIDPPFDQHLHVAIFEKLVPEFVNAGGLIYMELPVVEAALMQQLSTNISVIKERRFGDVMVFLLSHDG